MSEASKNEQNVNLDLVIKQEEETKACSLSEPAATAPVKIEQEVKDLPQSSNCEQDDTLVNLAEEAKPTPVPAATPEITVSTPITTFEEIQKQLKNTLDHVEQKNMVSGFQTLSKATSAVVDHCEQLGKNDTDQN